MCFSHPWIFLLMQRRETLMHAEADCPSPVNRTPNGRSRGRSADPEGSQHPEATAALPAPEVDNRALTLRARIFAYRAPTVRKRASKPRGEKCAMQNREGTKSSQARDNLSLRLCQFTPALFFLCALGVVCGSGAQQCGWQGLNGDPNPTQRRPKPDPNPTQY